MKRGHSKATAGFLAAAVLAGVILSYDFLSGSRGEARQVDAQRPLAAAVVSSGSVRPASSAADASSGGKVRASSAPESREDLAVVLTDELKNSVVGDPEKIKAGLASNDAVLVRVKDRRVLLDKNGSKRIYPASMTKIMTAVVAIEETENLSEKITLEKPIFDKMYAEDASMAGFLPDESVSMLDLLYGAILPSGAECCAGIAERLAGSEENFAAAMNRKAAALGLSGTHFTNTTGLHDANHYSTVRDIAALLCYALENPTFRRVFTTPNYTTSATNKHPDGVSFTSTMFRCLESPKAGKATLLGGKVGFTDQAGLCLASLAELDGTEYVLVTADAQNLYRGEIHDALAVYGSLGA